MADSISFQGFKRYFVNTSWLMFNRVLTMIVVLTVGIFVARYLGPKQFGLLSYALSFVALFTALSALGLNGILIREIVKAPELRDELLGTAFCLKAGGAILMSVCIAVTIPFTHNDSQTNIMIAMIAFSVIFQAFDVIDFNFQAAVRSKYVVYAKLVSLVASSLTKLIFIWISAPLLWFAYVYLIDAIVCSSGLVAVYLKTTGKVWHWKWRKHTAKKLLKDSWPMILSGMAISIYMKIDQVMIKEMLGAKAVGNYAAAVRLSEAWYFIPMSITSSVFPAIINAKKKGEDFYYQRLQKLYDLMVWLAVIIALPTTFLATLIIKVLYGEAFLSAAGVLKIHIWAGIFVFLNNATWRWHLTENNQKLAFVRLIIGALFNIIFNFFLIKKYGIVGAAFATLLSYSIAVYWGQLIFKQSHKIFLLHSKALLFISAPNIILKNPLNLKKQCR